MDDIYSANDTLKIQFSGPTDCMGRCRPQDRVHGASFDLELDKRQIADVFNFSHVLGKAYDGEWLEDGSAFVITIHDTNFSQVRLDSAYATDVNGTVMLVDGPTAVTLKGSFRQPKGNSPALDASTSNVSAALSGSFGTNATFPRVVSLVGRETVRHSSGRS